MKTERQRQHEQYKKRMDKQAERRRQSKAWDKANGYEDKPKVWWELALCIALCILI